MAFPCFYLPPVAWFARAKNSNSSLVEIEACENFHKQTLRNRCYIDSPNGAVPLTVPIDKSNFSDRGKCLMRDVRISRQYDWQRQHWAAIETSYFNSPFFEFLQDDFRPIFRRRWDFLLDLNETLIELCFRLLGIGLSTVRTTDFSAPAATPLSPSRPYYQVFAAKHGFLPDLSIIDLLFNMGNEAAVYL